MYGFSFSPSRPYPLAVFASPDEVAENGRDARSHQAADTVSVVSLLIAECFFLRLLREWAISEAA